MTRQTPFLQLDTSVATGLAARFTKAMPKVGIYYAVKANDNETLVTSLDTYLAGYDVASLTEIEYLLSLGVSPARLRYSNPVKVPAHIAGAFAKGVTYFAFDGLSEITKLAEYAPGSTVYLRLDVSNRGSRVPLSSKFGTDPTNAVTFCRAAVDAGLNVAGVTFHVGSQAENPTAWSDAIAIAGSVITDLDENGITIDFLDIGGGFPADYGTTVPTIEDIGMSVTTALERHIPARISVIAEPGRYLVANAGSLVTTVIGRETRGNEEWLYLDMGRFQGLTELFEMPGFLYPVRTDDTHGDETIAYTLTGPSCDSFDTLGSGYILPADMKVGDTVIIDATGAYTTVYGSTFNGFAIPPTYTA